VNQTNTIASSSMAANLFPVETLARTDQVSWRLSTRHIANNKIEKVESFKTDTSKGTEEWEKQLFLRFVDSKGSLHVRNFFPIANSEQMSSVSEYFYLRLSSSLPKTNKLTEWVSASTLLGRDQENLLRNSIESLFTSYSHEDFEDGMENEFVDELRAYILRYGTKTIDAIAKIIAGNTEKPQIIFEALRWLGQIKHPESYQARLFLLENSLRNPSRWVRDGAALGLAAFKDVHAIPYLRNAIEREQIHDLREDMEDVLKRLL